MSPSKLADYTLNPYAGCEHGCVYCYARFATRFSHPGEEWGSFVDIKTNAPELVAKEASRKRPGRVYISSVSDGWQPLEEKYNLTRRCLQALLEREYPLHIQTKNALIRRDLDLLRGRAGVELGTTLTTTDGEIAGLFEPKASTPAERIAVLNEAKDSGIVTFVFLGPLLPFISDRGAGLNELLRAVRETGVDYFLVDRLNPRFGIWPSLSRAVAGYDGRLVEEYRKILFRKDVREQYTDELRRRVDEEAGRLNLAGKMRLCF